MSKQVDLFNDDLTKYIPPKKEKEEEKRVTVYLPKSIYNNIQVLADNEDIKVSPYIKDYLIIPKLQEIANQLKEQSDKSKTKEPDSKN